MNARSLLLCAFLTLPALLQGKEIPLFLGLPMERSEDSEMFRHASEKVFSTELNIRALAENSVAPPLEQGPVYISLPGHAAFRVMKHHFKPVSGFTFDELGNVRVDPSVPNSGLSYYWYGRAIGLESAEIGVYIHEGVAAASIRFAAEPWVVTTGRDGAALRKLDPARMPGCGMPVVPRLVPTVEKLDSTSSAGSANAAHAKVVDTISVLVVYTGKALQESYSFEGISAAINLAIELANSAFKNSGMSTVSLRNVLTGSNAGILVPYNESPHIVDGNQRWLAHLFWVKDNTAKLRNQYAADVVSMVVFDPLWAGGRGFLQNASVNGADFEPLAFNVVNFVAAISSSNYAFAHELGHNLGMDHDLALSADPSNAVFPWSFGHYVYSKTQKVKDIMTQGGGKCGWSCEGALQYSNPEVNFIGYPGLPSGRNIADPGGYTRFNAKTGSILALPVSEYRGPTVVSRLFRSDFEHLQR